MLTQYSEYDVHDLLNDMDLQDRIWLTQGPQLLERRTAVPQQVLVYFITGNPGLIEYYRVFLNALDDEFSRVDNNITYHIVGFSLGGYELNSFQDEEHLPLSLENQVRHVEKSILRTAEEIQNRQREACRMRNSDEPRPLPVILIGHSVGTYIILQLIERRQQLQGKLGLKGGDDFELVGSICLFPTIVDIAKSPSGKKVGLFATSTYLAPTLHYVTKGLCAVCPTTALLALVKKVTGQNEGAAKVTAAFLGSRWGVLQALHMGRHELLEMTHDKWSDHVWNGPLPASSKVGGRDGNDPDRPKLYFYWGENDHWIDNGTRDAVIARRAARGDGKEDARPHMEIDVEGTPHDFCVNEASSEFVAKKAAEYVKEIVARLEL